MILRSGKRIGCDNLSIDFDNAKKNGKKINNQLVVGDLDI